MNAEEYCESEQLQRYVSFNFRQFITDEEGEELDRRFKCLVAKIGHLKHRDPKSITQAEQQLMDRERELSDSLEQRISKRVWDKVNSGAVLINRCPQCSRIVCTPQAKQCLWCGYDWH